MSKQDHPLVVIAQWTLDSSHVEQVRALLPELREKSLSERGCLSYEVLASTAAPESIVLIERYRDAAAIEDHRNTSHYRSIVAERILPALTHRQVQVLSTIDS